MDEEFQQLLNDFSAWISNSELQASNAQDFESANSDQAEAVLALFEMILQVATSNPTVAVNIINAANTLESTIVNSSTGVAVVNQSNLFVNSLFNLCLRTHVFSRVFKDMADRAIVKCKDSKELPVQALMYPAHIYYDNEITKAASKRFSTDMFKQTGNKFSKEVVGDDGSVAKVAHVETIETLYIFQTTLEAAREMVNTTIDELRSKN